MARKMSEMTMRKMQVPAYCPVVFGVQVMENKGVEVDVKNVIAHVVHTHH